MTILVGGNFEWVWDEVQIVSIGKTTGKQIHDYRKSMSVIVAGAF